MYLHRITPNSGHMDLAKQPTTGNYAVNSWPLRIRALQVFSIFGDFSMLLQIIDNLIAEMLTKAVTTAIRH